MKVKRESESCETLSDTMDCSPPGSSVHGIFQARVLGWGAIAFSNGRRLPGKKKKKKRVFKDEMAPSNLLIKQTVECGGKQKG